VDCNVFSKLLEEFLDGRLAAARMEAARDHLRECAACRETARMLGWGREGELPQPPPGLTAAILERTTGSPCAGARERLADFADRALGEVDNELVRLHLERCPECTAVARVLVRLAVDLPLLAELDPGERFTAEVVAATRAGRERGDRWVVRVATAWQGLVRRPRFAWEGAYVATILFVLVFGIPTAPFAGVSRQIRMLAGEPSAAAIGRPLSEFQDQLSGRVDELEERWQVLEQKATTASRQVRDDLARRSAGSWDQIVNFLGTIRDRLTSEEENEPAGPETDDRGRDQGEQDHERQ
jgi:hypothetical protein